MKIQDLRNLPLNDKLNFGAGEYRRVPSGWVLTQWFTENNLDHYTSVFIPEPDMSAKECVDCPNKVFLNL